ncbi:MAG: hypothetical protein IJM73_00895, partial [Spirochaetales bacterium]|nr:hypothetical protein [Spirochaetales bacterium]
EGADLFIQAYYRQSPEGANLRFNSTETYHPWDRTSDDLGTGLENTLLMVERLGRGGENAYALAAGPEKSSVYAALLCLDLEYTADNGVSYTDWVLPSVRELPAAAWNLTGIEGSLIYADQGLVFSSSSEKSEETFVSGGNTVNGVDCMHDFSTNGVKSASKPRDMLLPVLPVRRIGCRTEDRTAQKSRIPAESGTYRVGDTGPAGGYIVYDNGRKTDGWRYLEVSPSYLVIGDGGNPTLKSLAGKFASTYNPSKFINKAAVVKTGINTRYFVGCYYRREGYGKNLFVSGKHLYSPDCTSKNIGTGAENTQKLVEAMWEGEGRNSFIKASDSELFSAYFPANVCFRLSVTTDGTVYDDWFLPSIGELEKVGDLPDAIKAKLLDSNVACWSSSENPLSPTQMYSYNITTKMTAVKDRSKRIYVLAMRRF